MFSRSTYLFLLLGFLASACSIAENKKIDHKQTQATTAVLTIPADIRPLLKQEMIAVEKGMQELVTSIATADWHKTVQIAKQIQASYIMKQNLTAEQMEQLHHSLPEQFIALDHSFHKNAGMLAHAAEVKNADVANFYFYKMNDGCVQCHSRYAQEVFTGFSKREKAEHKH